MPNSNGIGSMSSTFGAGTVQRNVVGDGNSIVAGYNASTESQRWLNIVCAQMGAPVVNFGISAETTTLMISAYTDANHPGHAGVIQAGKRNILFALEGTNTIIRDGSTSAQALALWASYVALARATGWLICANTMPTLHEYNPAYDNTVNGYNDGLIASGTVAQISPYVYLCPGGIYGDVIADCYGAGIEISSDTIHPTDAGHATIAAVNNAARIAMGW
jgi:hypothetical protein